MNKPTDSSIATALDEVRRAGYYAAACDAIIDRAREIDAAACELPESLYSRVRRLIERPVRIEWTDPCHDWQAFDVLDAVNVGGRVSVRLRGRDDGDTKYCGDAYWVRLSEIKTIEEDA